MIFNKMFQNANWKDFWERVRSVKRVECDIVFILLAVFNWMEFLEDKEGVKFEPLLLSYNWYLCIFHMQNITTIMGQR